MAEKNKTYGRGKSSLNTTDNLTEIYGKSEPKNIDLECAVLGALLIQSDAIYSITDILNSASFFDNRHQEIFISLTNLGIKNHPIDILTVAQELKSRNKLDEIGGTAYLTSLTDRVATTAHLEYHSRIIQQKFIQRELIKSAAEIQKRSYNEDEDIEDLINFAEAEIFNISEGNIKSETKQINILVSDVMDQINEAAKNKNKLLGVPSGFSDIDRITSGWQPSDLVIIAARPSMGKTAFVLSMARNMTVDYNRPVAFFSLEMSSVQLIHRLISAEAEIPSDKLKRGDLISEEWELLENKLNNLTKAPMFIDETPAISIFEFRAKCRRLVRNHQIQAIIIDYLQLMTTNSDLRSNRQEEVSTISRTLKAIAKELKIPIIALSQLNRAVETRSKDKRPQLSDLRESGAIEQDADMVIFIHRPEYYGLTQDAEGNSLIGVAEIIIAKHRNGATGSKYLKFRNEFAKFSEFDNLTETIKFSSKMNESDDNERYIPDEYNNYF